MAGGHIKLTVLSLVFSVSFIPSLVLIVQRLKVSPMYQSFAVVGSNLGSGTLLFFCV